MGRDNDRQASISNFTFGEVRECDLCERERLCNDRDSLVACRECQAELLPPGWWY